MTIPMQPRYFMLGSSPLFGCSVCGSVIYGVAGQRQHDKFHAKYPMPAIPLPQPIVVPPAEEVVVNESC